MDNNWKNNEIAEKIKQQKEADMALLQSRWKNGVLNDEGNEENTAVCRKKILPECASGSSCKIPFENLNKFHIFCISKHQTSSSSRDIPAPPPPPTAAPRRTSPQKSPSKKTSKNDRREEARDKIRAGKSFASESNPVN